MLIKVVCLITLIAFWHLRMLLYVTVVRGVFGKSITANMLTAYYSKGCDSEKMFSELEISEAEDFKKHLNKYDVIHLDIQWCMEPAGGPERIVSYISEKTIQELREYYPNVLKESTTSLPEALAMINAETGNKFIIIIDEWMFDS